MTISATSQGLKPGVCTSSNRPANPFTGMIIFETDTNRLAVYNGSSWVFLVDADTPPALEHIKTQTFSASTSVNVDNVFTATYDNYLVQLNLTNASATTGIFMRLRSGGTTDSSSIYLLGGSISYMGSSILSAANSGGATTDWFLGSWDSANYPNMPFRIEIMQPYLAYRTAFFSSGFQPVSPMPYYRQIGGVTSNTTQYDGLAIIANSVSYNITGTIRVYGYRNS